MKTSVLTAPAVLCACGAAGAFYGLWWLFVTGLPPALVLLLFAPPAAAWILRAGAALKRAAPPVSAALLCGLAFFAAGACGGIAARRGADRAALVFPGLPEEAVVAVRGMLEDDPRLSRSARGIARLRLERAWDGRGVETGARGTVLVFFPEDAMPRLKEFGRGCAILVEGRFTPPPPRRGRPERAAPPLFRAAAVHVAHAAGPADRARTALRLRLLKLFDETWGGLAVALLLGIRDNLDGEFAARYAKAGCSYILALSGMHLAVISSVVAFLLKRPLGLKGAAAAGSVFIAAYVYLAGAQASLYRSALMYLLGAGAVIRALPANGLLLLALSFLIQLALDPLSGDSVSFILSYAALLGILAGMKPLAALFRGYAPAALLNALVVSIAAFSATMAVSVFFFGELRCVGLLAGLLIAPLTTCFMIGSMAYLALGAIPAVKTPAGFPLKLLYMLMEKIAESAGAVPGLRLEPAAPVIALCVLIPVVLVCAGRAAARLRGPSPETPDAERGLASGRSPRGFPRRRAT